MTRAIFYKSLIFIIISVMYVPYHSIAGDIPYEEVEKAAIDGLRSLLKNRRIEQSSWMGFDTQAEIDNAELGEGFQVFYILTDKHFDESFNQNYWSMVWPTTTWKFPVLSGGKGKTLLEVACRNGKCETFRMGGSGLAHLMVNFRAAFPILSGYHCRLIKNLLIEESFFELSQGFTLLGIIPIDPTKTKKEFSLSDLCDPQDILKKVRDAEKRRMNTGNKYRNINFLID